MSKFKNVLITGASSGLGRALAVEFSKKTQNLFLCARNFENLQETKNLCQNSNANIYLKILDVKDEIASRNYIAEIEENFAQLVLKSFSFFFGISGNSNYYPTITDYCIYTSDYLSGSIDSLKPF